ncbi:alginate O-acetyltransferase AlgX-related protein [Massilia niastensis]|uniref:alginate O-acetyltransferase AlgX-related protein n=1 Tax=Massilia niastensis TaxID=544911 RepID=UPI00037CFFEF|nr:hypothetical protein [Massilia niastensis]
MSYQFELEPLKCSDFERLITKWNLDLPKGTESLDKPGMVRIRGWVLTKEAAQVVLLLKSPGSTVREPLNRARPDVIRTVIGGNPEECPQLVCGFDLQIRMDTSPVQLGFEVDGVAHWIRTIKLKKVLKVLQGEKGYLFLANDSNRSVDQFEGNFPITERNLERWDQYFASMVRTKEDRFFRWTLMVAPGKEYLFPEYYPFQRAESTPVDQFRQRFARFEHEILCAWDEFEAHRELSYPKSDTHWTDYGASIAARQVCQALGLDTQLDDSVRYRLEMRTGDLGSKLNPPVRYPMYVAGFGQTPARLVFDNGITNHGKILAYENTEAPVDARAVLFGDSFSVNMVRWLSLVFRRIVLVHSAASVDPEVLEVENPDYVIAQTNARFVVSPAVFDLDSRNVVREKIGGFSAQERAALEEHISRQPDVAYKGWILDALYSAEKGELMC